jgi:hypothetical protein
MENIKKIVNDSIKKNYIIQLLSLAAKSLKTTKLTASTDDNIY